MGYDSLHIQAEANICNEIWPHRVVLRVNYTDSRRVDHILERELFVNKPLEDFDLSTPDCQQVNYMEFFIPANTCLLPLPCSTLMKKYYIHLSCPTLGNLEWYVEHIHLLRAGDAGPMGDDPDRLTVPSNALLFYDVERKLAILGAPGDRDNAGGGMGTLGVGIAIGVGVMFGAMLLSTGVLTLARWLNGEKNDPFRDKKTTR